MAIWESVMSFVGGIFKPAVDLVDNLNTSDEERLKLRNAMAEIEREMTTRIIDAEVKIALMQADVIKSEASGVSKLQRLWRPITMMVFLFIIVYQGFAVSLFGLPSIDLSMIPAKMWDLLTLGIGGYIAGRSIEKAVSNWSKK